MQGDRLIKIGGKLPINLPVGAYYNAVRPEFGATWQLRTQIAVIFQGRTDHDLPYKLHKPHAVKRRRPVAR
jgi:hypothetical protein